jgi:N4-gp56 family major capsid protein
MASTVNTSANYAGAIDRIIDRQALQVAQRYLVIYQFADKKQMEKGVGNVWTAIRWNRLPLPTAPIAEGVPPNPNALTFDRVQGVAVQWAQRIVFTDVAMETVQQDLLNIASGRLGQSLAEMKERNGYNNAMTGVQVNYVNSRGSRAALQAGDNLDPTTIYRTYANLSNIGAPKWNGQTGETIDRAMDYNQKQFRRSMPGVEHYVAIVNDFPLQDLRNNPQVVATWQNNANTAEKLYMNELGYWGGLTFVISNLIPNFVGIEQVNGSNAVGNLTTGTYTVQVTGWDNQNFYESQIYQVSTDVSVTTGGISVTVPSTTGYTYAVYVGVGSGAAPAQLGLTASGPSSGPYAGQAIMIAPGTTVTITGLGLYQIPPAAPATGVTVWPTFIFGQKAFACLKLMDVSWNRLYTADKADPHNQQRVIGWKVMEGWVILNQQFMCRIESTASNNGTFG